MTQAVEKKPDRIENFIAFLGKQDRAAFAELRRSLSFDPGTYPPSFPPVEPFVMEARGAWERNAFYLIAGLFALVERPLEKSEITVQDEITEDSLGLSPTYRSFGNAVVELYNRRAPNNSSIEARFISLLDSDEEQLPNRLRHMVSLVHADEIRIEWTKLLWDVIGWRSEDKPPRVRWARDFYGHVIGAENTVQDAE